MFKNIRNLLDMFNRKEITEYQLSLWLASYDIDPIWAKNEVQWVYPNKLNFDALFNGLNKNA